MQQAPQDQIHHAPFDPKFECTACARLVEFRREWQDKEPEWYNAPVPSFGDWQGQLLIVGLAPGLRGANRTGRPFTGDFAGDLLYATLQKFGFAVGTYGSSPDDGLALTNCLITNAVRCVPPQNKPIGEEQANCRPHLFHVASSMPNLRAIIALGKIAHDAVLRTFSLKLASYKFAHGAIHDWGSGLVLIDSYHCSRYNTNTGKLTPEMFESVFRITGEHVR